MTKRGIVFLNTKISVFAVLSLFLFIFSAKNAFSNGPSSKLLQNDDLRIDLSFSEVANNNPVGWTGAVAGTWENFTYDKATGIASFRFTRSWQGMVKEVELPPGHYLFRTEIKTNSYAVKLYAQPLDYPGTFFVLPAGISDEFKNAELPFYVEGTGEEKKRFKAGVAWTYSDPAKHEAIVQLKKLEIIRVGDTVLPEQWAAKTPVHALHKLDAIMEDSNYNQPGKVIFKDTLLGTELWMMTRGSKTHLLYVGYPNFSKNGKYLHAGMQEPGDIVRTDGFCRYPNPSRRKPNNWHRKVLWPFPWEQKRVLENTDPSDWICPVRTKEYVKMLNLATGKTHTITLPSKPGWKIIQIPSDNMAKGLNIQEITHEVLVWQSEDRKQLGLSDIDGNRFRTFKIKSISKNPENDVIYPKGKRGSLDFYAMNSVWGKSGKGWVNALGNDGIRYFAFEINRDKFLTDEDPYQVWMLPLSLTDKRGLLRAVPNPRAKQVTWANLKGTWTGDTWWNLSGGVPKSGDKAAVYLEDGTLVHMSSLGMHSNMHNTFIVQSAYENIVKFIGSYPKADRISWPHEFRIDKDFAVIESFAEPNTPVVMVDLENETLWTVAMMNVTDYKQRYSTRRNPGAYDKPVIWPAPAPSPDYTKIVYCSTMLSGAGTNYPERKLADTYIAVARYPQPPEKVKVEGSELLWEKPRYSSEIEGFNIYRSDESGKNYAKANKEPVRDTRYRLPAGKNGFYALTSVEYSGLESRMFSNEACVGNNRTFRHFYQPETGKITRPMVPFFEPAGTSNSYAVAVTDPEFIYREKLSNGLKGSVKLNIDIPAGGSCKIMGRVRGMSQLERSSYTTGWPKERRKLGKGSFAVKINGKQTGNISVDCFGWKWLPLNSGKVQLEAGIAELEFETGDVGIALDSILVTNDLAFRPPDMGNAPTAKPSRPQKLSIENLAYAGKEPLQWRGYTVNPPYVKLSWDTSDAPQGIRYYNVYRSTQKNFKPSQKNLFGSTNELFFINTELEKGKEYFYKVAAVDSWDNTSEPSNQISVKVY